MSTVDERARELGHAYGSLVRESLGDQADSYDPFGSIVGLQPAAIFVQVHGRVPEAADATDRAEIDRLEVSWREGYDAALNA